MAKYIWEAKPPLTRSDLFADSWEIGTIYADNDEKAIAWAEKTFKRHNVGLPLTIRISCEGRAVRTIKSIPDAPNGKASDC